MILTWSLSLIPRDSMKNELKRTGLKSMGIAAKSVLVWFVRGRPPGVRCLILSNRWDCVGSMCAPNLHITSLPISIWPLIASERGAGGSVSQGVPTRMGANISGTYFLPILCEKAGSLKKKLWLRVTFYPHRPGRPLRINLMSWYICFSQIGPFDVSFEDLFSKVQNPGEFQKDRF